MFESFFTFFYLIVLFLLRNSNRKVRTSISKKLVDMKPSMVSFAFFVSSFSGGFFLVFMHVCFGIFLFGIFFFSPFCSSDPSWHMMPASKHCFMDNV